MKTKTTRFITDIKTAKAVKYIQSGKENKLPQYENIDEKAVKNFVKLLLNDKFCIKQLCGQTYEFNAKMVKKGVEEKFVIGGLLEKGDRMSKHELTPAAVEVYRYIVMSKD